MKIISVFLKVYKDGKELSEDIERFGKDYKFVKFIREDVDNSFNKPFYSILVEEQTEALDEALNVTMSNADVKNICGIDLSKNMAK